MIAIHYQQGNNFSGRWRTYCDNHQLMYKLVCCYDSDILDRLKDCHILLWHVDHFNYRDQIFAKHLIKSLEHRKIRVFPDFNTIWHFDDKIAQKYLLEAIQLPFVGTKVFYDKNEALAWARDTTYPKVFKLRKGSGSKNVRLIESEKDATRLIKRAFGKGFSVVDMMFLLRERYRKYRLKKESLLGVMKGLIRVVIGSEFVAYSPKEIGYFYAQDFIPNNKFDIRVIVIGQRAFAIKRMVRDNDFRASGSGHIIYDKEQIDISIVKMAFNCNAHLGAQCVAYDFIFDESGSPLIVELSFGFNQLVYTKCPGYWDKDLNWNAGEFFPQDWMIGDLLAAYNQTKIFD